MNTSKMLHVRSLSCLTKTNYAMQISRNTVLMQKQSGLGRFSMKRNSLLSNYSLSDNFLFPLEVNKNIISWNRTFRPNFYQSTRFSHSISIMGETLDLNLVVDYVNYLQEEWTKLQESSNLKKLGQERSFYLEDVLHFRESLVEKYTELKELEILIQGLHVGSSEADKEILHIAEQDKKDVELAVEELLTEIITRSVPSDKMDNNDVMIEISSGVGGQESMIFVADCVEMYKNYCNYKGWTFDLDQEASIFSKVYTYEAMQKAVAYISGKGAYRFFKYEGGVQRFQRETRVKVPRVFFSCTITVAVLPQPTEVDIVLDPKDITISTTKASGPGGQHVNKTESAVRITHIPTGFTTECQETRSQLHNKEIALRKLRLMLYKEEMRLAKQEESHQRKLQVGYAGYNEKIRTYNFRDNRVTDHRLQRSYYNIELLMSGGEDMDNFVEEIQRVAILEQFLELLKNFEKQKKSEN